MTLADQLGGQVREYARDNPMSPAARELGAALLAVIDKCEAMRAESDMNAPIRWAITDRIESVIADALGIQH